MIFQIKDHAVVLWQIFRPYPAPQDIGSHTAEGQSQSLPPPVFFRPEMKLNSRLKNILQMPVRYWLSPVTHRNQKTIGSL